MSNKCADYLWIFIVYPKNFLDVHKKNLVHIIWNKVDRWKLAADVSEKKYKFTEKINIMKGNCWLKK